MRKQVVLGIFAASLVVTGLLGSSQTANAAVSPDGSLVKAPGGTVYLIENGQRRPFRVPEVFYSHGFNFNQVIQATAEDLALPLGSLMVYRDGTLIKAPFDPLVYLVTNGQKRGFQSAAAFLGLGYSFNNVVTVDPTTFDDLPTGAAITSTGLPHDPGAIVIFSDGTVYLITETGRKGFATAEDFLSHGYAFDQLVAANQADASLPFEGVMSRRTTIPGATLPDFAVGEMSVSPRLANASFAIEINKEAVVKFAIKNQGAGTQKPDFGLSYPSGLQPVKVDGSIPENTCKDITRLEANQSCTYAVKVTFNQLSESFTGDRMRLDIDHLNSIAESDESNNWGIINFAVRSAASRPKITSLEPNSGPSGTRVVITGTDLILTGQIVSVKFGTTQAEVPFGTSNSTHTVVPNLSPGTYAVTVQVGPYTTNAL
ncbi:MAG: IPT/TIG domain-containing protein, partial [Candidatus Doudnabacteria bacterium]|nr:IPT/TIG domain-containing protein [Candidatus Doudnabacteria bacterium]